MNKKNKTDIIKEPAVQYLDTFKTQDVDESWDFRTANTKEYTHCYHTYPAMMIPQVARRILKNYGKSASLLFDPYCGTGTSLVEANLKGIDAVGTDINPLARLIAEAKTTKIDIQVLDLFIYDFINYFFSINFNLDRLKSVVIPEVKNMDFWFSKTVQKKLGALNYYIQNINNKGVSSFFKVAFSETVREVSYQKLREFKLVRRKDYAETEDKDVFGIMVSKLSRNKQGLIDYQEDVIESKTQLFDFNSVDGVPETILPANSVDIVLTSPPYGDSRTTVAYGQYSRLSNEWLGIQEANKIDGKLMGGAKTEHQGEFKSDVLNRVVFSIKKKDEKRVRDVVSFYEDYEKSIKNVSRTIKQDGYACYVVGNRTVKGVTIPTDEITADMFKENNFKHIETIVRNIPNKRMPLKNSPSNVVGKTASTMKHEYIVICQKK